MDWYLSTYGDPLCKHTPPWFRALVWSELLIQLPFFCYGAYAFAVGDPRVQKPVCRCLLSPLSQQGARGMDYGPPVRRAPCRVTWCLSSSRRNADKTSARARHTSPIAVLNLRTAGSECSHNAWGSPCKVVPSCSRGSPANTN